MAYTFMVSSTNSETTVIQSRVDTKGNVRTRLRTEVNADTNEVIGDWLKHCALPTEPSTEVDAAFVWACVFDKKFLQPLSGLVRNTDAFSTAVMSGFTYGSMAEVLLEFPPNLITPVPYRCDQVVLVR